MKKFKVFKVNQAFMAKMGIYSPNFADNSINLYKSIVRHIITFILLTIILASGPYAMKNASVDIKSTLNSCKMIVAGIQSIGTFLSLGFKMNKTKEFHLKMQEIIDKSMLY